MDIDGKNLRHTALQEMRELSSTIAPQPMAEADDIARAPVCGIDFWPTPVS
jgi:hypothetical protein